MAARGVRIRRFLVAVLAALPLVAACPAAREADPVTVTSIANEGFLISSSGRKILIDALFRDGVAGYAVSSPSRREAMEKAVDPFDDVDLVLATHHHADHFDPVAVAAHMSSNPRAILVTTPQAIERMRSAVPAFEELTGRIREVLPPEGRAVPVEIPGFDLRVLNLHHGRDRPIENLGFLVTVGGMTLLHMGDTQATESDLRASGLGSTTIDIVFVPFWHLVDEAGRRAVRETIRPAHVVVMHLPPREMEDDYIRGRGGWDAMVAAMERDVPGATIFREAMTTKSFR